MGSSTKIYLPLHVKGENVLFVIAKVVGEEWVQGNFGKQVFERGSLTQKNLPKPFDPTRPGSEENDWHIKFVRRDDKLAVKAASERMDYGYMHFGDAAGTEHAWFWSVEDECETHKTLSPGAHALGMAVGRRLVAFFGGSICYNDSNDDINYRVSPASAKLPRFKTGKQTSNERWFQFYNLLYNEPLLKAAELRRAIARQGNRSSDEKLLTHLERLEAAEKLERRLPEASSENPLPRPRF